MGTSIREGRKGGEKVVKFDLVRKRTKRDFLETSTNSLSFPPPSSVSSSPVCMCMYIVHVHIFETSIRTRTRTGLLYRRHDKIQKFLEKRKSSTSLQ